MDEIFGYFPPVANPPSKAPLLTLLKQARAFGLGVVLATQNPVDLDYKGLANTGTWFIGRLQTERDKARVIEGLEGAAASSGKKFDRQRMEQILAGLGNRVFLLQQRPRRRAGSVSDALDAVVSARAAHAYANQAADGSSQDGRRIGGRRQGGQKKVDLDWGRLQRAGTGVSRPMCPAGCLRNILFRSEVVTSGREHVGLSADGVGRGAGAIRQM